MNPRVFSQEKIAKLDVRVRKSLNLRTLKHEVFGKEIYLAGYNNR